MYNSTEANQIEDMLGVLFEEGDLVELRAIPHDRSERPSRRYMRIGEDTTDALAWIAQHNETRSIYIGVNPRRREGGKADDVKTFRAVFCDLDGGCTPQDAAQRVDDAGLPEPSAVVATGGGVHCYWRLSEPLDDPDQWGRLQKALRAAVGGDNVVDPPRVMRLAGTVNRKPERGGAACELHSFHEDRFDLAELAEPLAKYEQPDGDRDPAQVGHIDITGDAQVPPQVQELIANDFAFRQTWDREREDFADQSPSSYDMAIASALCWQGFSDQVVADAIAAWRELHCTDPAGVAKGKRVDYVRRTIAKAREGIPDCVVEGENNVESDIPSTPEAKKPDPFQPFPVEQLPEPLHSFTDTAATAIGCDPSFVALPLLVACGAAIGHTRVMRIKQGWHEPPTLWGAVVGDSGTSKTPAISAALKPLKDAQSAAFKENEHAQQEYQVALQKYEAEMSAWKKKPSGEPPEKPAEPVPARCVVSDTTVEALAPILQGNPRGVLLSRDELSGWLASFDRYAKGGKGGGDAAAWLSAYHGEPWTIDRKSGGTLHVPAACVSIAGGIQPDILRRALAGENTENGLAARLLMTYPPRRPKRWTEKGIAPSEAATLALLVEELRQLRPGTDGDNPEPVAVEFTRDAKQAYVAFYERHADELAELTGPLAASFSKLEATCARLALIVHQVRLAASNCTVQDHLAVDVESVERAIGLCEWFKTETRRVHGMLSESEGDRERRELVRWIEAQGGAVTARDLMRTSRRYKNARDAEAELDELVSGGVATWEQPPQNGRGKPPAKVCRIVENVNNGGSADQNRTGDPVSANLVNVNTVNTPQTKKEEGGEGWYGGVII